MLIGNNVAVVRSGQNQNQGYGPRAQRSVAGGRKTERKTDRCRRKRKGSRYCTRWMPVTLMLTTAGAAASTARVIAVLRPRMIAVCRSVFLSEIGLHLLRLGRGRRGLLRLGTFVTAHGEPGHAEENKGALHTCMIHSRKRLSFPSYVEEEYAVSIERQRHIIPYPARKKKHLRLENNAGAMDTYKVKIFSNMHYLILRLKPGQVRNRTGRNV